MHPADLYDETHKRVVIIASELDPDLAVPACPGWTVHGVVAHLVGLAADVVSGRVSGYAGPTWTDRQVSERAARPMPHLLREWEQVLPRFLAVNRDLAGSDLPDMVEHILGPVPKTSFESAFHVDLLHHEHDLLGAAGTPRQSPLPADIAAMKSQLANVRLRFAADQLPTLRIAPSDTDRSWNVGTGAPRANLQARLIDVLRAFGGRRTHDEIRSFDWTGDFENMPERLVLPFFQAPASPLRGG